MASSIMIDKIPWDKNNIGDLYKHYMRFGYIKSIYSNKSEASITFKDGSSAQKAVKDPVPLLNDRFIQISLRNDPKPLLSYVKYDSFSQIVEEKNKLNEVRTLEEKIHSLEDKMEKLDKENEDEDEEAKTKKEEQKEKYTTKIQELKEQLQNLKDVENVEKEEQKQDD